MPCEYLTIFFKDFKIFEIKKDTLKLQNVYRMYKFTRGFMQLLKEQLTGAALYQGG